MQNEDLRFNIIMKNITCTTNWCSHISHTSREHHMFIQHKFFILCINVGMFSIFTCS